MSQRRASSRSTRTATDASANGVRNARAKRSSAAPGPAAKKTKSNESAPTPPSSLLAPPPPLPPPAKAHPLHFLQQLLERTPNSDPLQMTALTHAAPRCPAHVHSPPRVPRVIHCHDMGGGFNEDVDSQHGAAHFCAYNFQFWKFVDLFVYFSHARVAMPPSMWTTAAHRNGVKILGNFCTEWEDGRQENIRLLDGPRGGRTDGWKTYAQRLVSLAEEYNFDGWFLNIESPLDAQRRPLRSRTKNDAPEYVVKMTEFLSYLTHLMHAARPGSLVLWYDAVSAVDGAVRWQSRLNSQNACFFDAVDGLFTDYHWQESWPQDSATAAGGRKADVYTGVDIFGRGSFGGGGLQITRALRVIQEAQTSLALFAPAWTYEGEGRREAGRAAFESCERRLWLGDFGSDTHREQSIADFVDRRRMPLHAIRHAFNTGNGRHFFLHGTRVDDDAFATDASSAVDSTPSASSLATASPSESRPWFNLALQDNQTVLVDGLLCGGTLAPAADSNSSVDSSILHACARLTHEVAYDGGSCFEIEATLEAAAKSRDEATASSSSSLATSCTVNFDCFEFGPRDAATATIEEDWQVRFVYARPSTAFTIALRFELDDAKRTSYLVEDAAATEPDEAAHAWRTVSGRLPAALLRGSNVAKVQVQLRYHPSRAEPQSQPSSSSSHRIRLGQVCLIPSSVAAPSLAPATSSPPSPSPISFTRYPCAESDPSADAFLIRWDAATVAASSRPDSYDVFLDGCWTARVLTPQYFAAKLALHSLLGPVAPLSRAAVAAGLTLAAASSSAHSDGFRVAVRVNLVDGSNVLMEAAYTES